MPAPKAPDRTTSSAPRCDKIVEGGGIMSYHCSIPQGHETETLDPADPQPCYAVESSPSVRRWQQWAEREYDRQHAPAEAEQPKRVVINCPKCHEPAMVVRDAEAECENCGQRAEVSPRIEDMTEIGEPMVPGDGLVSTALPDPERDEEIRAAAQAFAPAAEEAPAEPASDPEWLVIAEGSKRPDDGQIKMMRELHADFVSNSHPDFRFRVHFNNDEINVEPIPPMQRVLTPEQVAAEEASRQGSTMRISEHVTVPRDDASQFDPALHEIPAEQPEPQQPSSPFSGVTVKREDLDEVPPHLISKIQHDMRYLEDGCPREGHIVNRVGCEMRPAAEREGLPPATSIDKGFALAVAAADAEEQWVDSDLTINQQTGEMTEHIRTRPEDQILPSGDESIPDDQSLVIADMEARREVGIQRYRQGHRPFNGRNTLLDAYEEMLDGSVYLRSLLRTRETTVGALAEIFTSLLKQVADRFDIDVTYVTMDEGDSLPDLLAERVADYVTLQIAGDGEHPDFARMRQSLDVLPMSLTYGDWLRDDLTDLERAQANEIAAEVLIGFKHSAKEHGFLKPGIDDNKTPEEI